MADKLILNANMICKADRFEPKKCTVEKVIEVSDSEFKKFIENPMKRNYYLPQYKDLMGYYDDSYHGVMFVNIENGDGLLVNSEGYDYARYSQYIPNASDLIQQYEQTAALDALKTHMDNCIDKWLEPNKPAYVTEIGDDYQSIHDAVGGLIEPIYFLHERGVVMVGNEEAKLRNMEGNRRFDDGIVAGPFIICGDNGEDFCSLSDEQCEKYVRQFAEPENITRQEVEDDMKIEITFFIGERYEKYGNDNA